MALSEAVAMAARRIGEHFQHSESQLRYFLKQLVVLSRFFACAPVTGKGLCHCGPQSVLASRFDSLLVDNVTSLYKLWMNGASHHVGEVMQYFCLQCFDEVFLSENVDSGQKNERVSRKLFICRTAVHAASFGGQFKVVEEVDHLFDYVRIVSVTEVVKVVIVGMRLEIEDT